MKLQHPQTSTRRALAVCMLLGSAASLLPGHLSAQPAPASPAPAAAPAPRRGEPVTLNFSNADIEAVARTMATITGRNVVVDPRVKGTISLTTEQPVTPAVAYSQFLAVLRLQGYTVVSTPGLDKIVPEADAKLQSGAVFSEQMVAGNQIATQIFKLNFENANTLLPILRPLISPNNTINVNAGNNSLVITDYGDNLRRIAQIIAAMDVANATDVEVINLRHGIAMDMAPLVLRLLDASGTAGQPAAADGSFKTMLIAEPRSNALILRAANPARLALARTLIDKLDQPASQNPDGNIHVVYLKNAEATKLAVTLRAAMAGGTGAVAATTATTTTPAVPAAATTGGQIQADPVTNSLIITAPEPQYRQLRAVIDKLDARRAQVFVESLIAEVNANKAAEFGIQWQGAIGKVGDSAVGLMGTNFGTGGNNIVNISTQAGGTVLPGRGLNAGVATQNNGIYVLGFLARMLETSGDGNVLSTPNLLTLDNEEAKIVIGQNVPFVTGQYSTTGSTATVSPFQTIERKDVGLTLRVKPQISENGTVRMTIYQEVSSVDKSETNTAGLITNKRSIETNVLVSDGGIVVLGGLLQDEYTGSEEKVPVLGDIPILGALFRYEGRTRKKTNLMVFLRPVVVRDAAASNSVSQDRYDFMQSLQQRAQPQPSATVPINDAPVLPPLTRPPVAPPATPAPTQTPAPAPAAPSVGTPAPAPAAAAAVSLPPY